MAKPASHITCNTCDLTSFCLIENHTTVKQFRTFKRNELICAVNEKFNSLYAIKKGVIKTFQIDADGKELIRRFNFRGEVLGYEAIHNGTFPYTAVALCETTVCDIPYQHFVDLLHTKPVLMKHFLDLMSKQLTANSYLDMNTAEQRLASFILDLTQRLHMINSSELILPMSRQDIGNYLRLSAETVSRIFSRLQKNKILEINHKNILILKHSKLMEIADVAHSHSRKKIHADF